MLGPSHYAYSGVRYNSITLTSIMIPTQANYMSGRRDSSNCHGMYMMVGLTNPEGSVTSIILGRFLSEFHNYIFQHIIIK